MSGFSWNWEFAWQIMPELLAGLRITLLATIFGTAAALVLGFVWTMLRIAEIPIVSPITTLVVQFFRGTPFLVQLYFLFYVLPGYGIVMSPMTTGILGLALYNGAMVSEIYRAGIENVPEGQWEASLSLSLPLPWVWSHIILPQVLRSILPMLGNVPVVMFKETAVLSVITITEVVAAARDLAQLEYRFIEPYTITAGLYLVLSYAAVLGVRRLERWSAKGG